MVLVEDGGGDGVAVLVVFAVVGGVAAGARTREVGGEVAPVGERARSVAL